MKPLLSITAFTVVIALFPMVTDSGVHLNFVMMALYAGLMGMAWNLLAGFGGQFSFGHALFFGFGAYTHIIAQLSWSINPWFAIFLAIMVSALVGAMVGALSFRYGLKGSYFALVTLAFAEVARILALSVDITGGGVGLMLPLKPSVANMQFESRVGYYYLMVVMVMIALLITQWLKGARFGAYLQAIRDNEDAARAVGVDPFQVKLRAIAVSGAMMGAAGAFYVQVFQYIDPAIAFGPQASVEALVAAIVGGIGTVWGPLLGAVLLHTLSDLTRNLFGALPGINMIIYGSVLVLIVMFLPRGIAGTGSSVRDLFGKKRS